MSLQIYLKCPPGWTQGGWSVLIRSLPWPTGGASFFIMLYQRPVGKTKHSELLKADFVTLAATCL